MPGAMKIHTSYTASIRGQLSDDGACVPVSDYLMNCTARLCLSALKFCANAFLEHWDILGTLEAPERKTAAEALVHTTKYNKAQYPEFDVRFHSLPSGVRRTIRNDALGKASSYVSNHRNWEALKLSERGEEPTLGLPSRYQLTFYKSERKTESLNNGQVLLKLYNGKTWEWYTFLLKPSDARYLARMIERPTMLFPTVEKVRGEQPDIIITHDCPASIIDWETHGHCTSVSRTLEHIADIVVAKKIPVNKWFFGHLHIQWNGWIARSATSV